MISKAKFFVKRMATPLACEEKLEKTALPPHSAFTRCSISLLILVSDSRIMLGLFFFKACRTFDLLGFFPIEFGLKAMSLNFEADGSFLFNCSWLFISFYYCEYFMKNLCCQFFLRSNFMLNLYFIFIYYYSIYFIIQC